MGGLGFFFFFFLNRLSHLPFPMPQLLGDGHSEISSDVFQGKLLLLSH